MRVKLMILLLILMASTGCSKYDFDGFDPTTSALRWIMKGENNE
jgi:hypothetical protein